jgi:hypothetical protein
MKCSLNQSWANVKESSMQVTLCWVGWFSPVIPGTWEAEMEGSWLEANPGKKSEILFQTTSQVLWSIPVIPAMWEVEVGGLWSEGSLKNKLN